MHVYFDESGGLDHDWLVMAGVAFPDHAHRDAAESTWQRSGRKGRKWSREQFVELARFLRNHNAIATGCHVQLTSELRSALDLRAATARLMQLHVAHDPRAKPLRAYSWLWQQLVAHFAGLLIEFMLRTDFVVTDLSFHPDRSSMPTWQLNIVRDALAHLTGPNLSRQLPSAERLGVSPSVREEMMRKCRWGAPRFISSGRSSRLVDAADGYCSLYVLAMREFSVAKQIIREGAGLEVERLCTDLTRPMLYRAQLGWLESAQTMHYPDGFGCDG